MVVDVLLTEYYPVWLGEALYHVTQYFSASSFLDYLNINMETIWSSETSVII
jgi:hypothetical protein